MSPWIRSGRMNAGQTTWERDLRDVVVPGARTSGMAVTSADGDLFDVVGSYLATSALLNEVEVPAPPPQG
jgi:hypothetical protein